MTLPALAQIALDTLNAQRQYFKSRSTTDLIFSKGLERELMEKATEALSVAETKCYCCRESGCQSGCRCSDLPD